MRAQKSGHHPHGLLLPGRAGHAHEALFGGAVEAVAAFRFQGGYPVAAKPREVVQGMGQQLCFRGRAGGAYRAQNAPGQDVRVRLAAQLALELIGAVAAECEVGVALHHARHHHAARGINEAGTGPDAGRVQLMAPTAAMSVPTQASHVAVLNYGPVAERGPGQGAVRSCAAQG